MDAADVEAITKIVKTVGAEFKGRPMRTSSSGLSFKPLLFPERSLALIIIWRWLF